MNNIPAKKGVKSKVSTGIVLILAIYIFFSYTIPSLINHMILLISLGGLIYCVIKKRKISITHQQLLPIMLLFFYASYQVIMAPMSIYPIDSTKSAIFRFILMSIGLCIYLCGGWYEKGIKIIFIFASIHTVSTILLYLMPSIFLNISSNFLSNDIIQEMIYFMRRNTYSGITNQVGVNSFFITVGISILCSCLFADTENKKLKMKRMLLLGLFFLALLLTGKRAHLIINIGCILFISMVKAKSEGKNIFGKLLKSTIIILTGIVILVIIIPDASAPIQKFIQKQGGDQTSGRINLYARAIDMIIEKSITGWGTAVYNYRYEIGVHNLYLQLLVENGLIGFLLFVSLLLVNFINTIKVINFARINYSNTVNRNKINYYLYFSLYFQLFYIVYGLTGNPLNDPFILISYLIISSIPYSLRIYKNGF